MSAFSIASNPALNKFMYSAGLPGHADVGRVGSFSLDVALTLTEYLGCDEDWCRILSRTAVIRSF